MNVDLSLVTVIPADATWNEWLFQARKESFWWIIERVWGEWDEPLHRGFFDEDYRGCQPQLIMCGNEVAGSYCCTRDEDCYQFGNFFVLPDYQDRVLAVTDKEGVPVRLVHWNFNPASRLYARVGFRQIERHDFPDTEDYWVIVERKPGKSDGYK